METWHKTLDWLFGYDCFLAHRSVDGKPYATNLFQALIANGNGFDCFLDVKHYHAGGQLTSLQSRALRKTTRLIVVVTPRSHDEDANYLRGEIVEFRRKHPNGVIVPIGTTETLSETFYPESKLLPLIPHLPNDICLIEGIDCFAQGVPSLSAIGKLVNDFSEERSSAKRLRWIQRFSAILILLLFASILLLVDTYRQRLKTEKEAQRANRQLGEVSLQLAIQAKETKALARESAPIEAAHHFYRAATALKRAGEGDASRDAALAATIQVRRLLRTLPHGIGVKGATRSLNGSCIATWGFDNKIRLWNATNSEPMGKPMRHDDGVGGVAFDWSGKRMVSWGSSEYRDGVMRLWDLDTNTTIGAPMGYGKGTVWGTRFSWDNHRLLTWDRAFNIYQTLTVRLWNAQTGELVRSLDADVAPLFSWSGKWILGWRKDSIYLWDSDGGMPVGTPFNHPGVTGAVFNWDDRQILSWSSDGTVRLWTVSSGESIVGNNKHKDAVFGAAFSWDGKRILSWCKDTALLWDWTTGAFVNFPMDSADEVREVAFSSDDRHILAWTEKGRLRTWDGETGRQLEVVERSIPALYSTLSFVPEALSQTWHRKTLLWQATADQTEVGRWEAMVKSDPLYWCDESMEVRKDGTVQIWKKGADLPIGGFVAASRDGKRALIKQGQHKLWLWDCKEKLPIAKISEDETVAKFSRDANRFLTRSKTDLAWRLWDSATGYQIGRIGERASEAKDAAFSHDGSHLVSWNTDGTIRLFDARTGEPVNELMKHDDSISGAIFNWDGTRIVSWSENGMGKIWDTRNRSQIGKTMDGFQVANTFSEDDKRILSRAKQWFRLWDTKSGDPVGDLIPFVGMYKAGTFSYDGKRALIMGGDGVARLCDTETGHLIGSPLTHSDRITDVFFSWDSKQIYTIGYSYVRIWSSLDGKAISPRIDAPNSPKAILSWNGKRLLSGSSGNQMRVWNTESMQPVGIPMKHEELIRGAVFSWDGRRILSWSSDGTARVWDTETGVPIGRPLEHGSLVRSAAFSWDGKRILTGTADALMLWSASSTALIADFKGSDIGYSPWFDPSGKCIWSTGSFDKLQMWDISQDDHPLEEQILEFEIRSATELTANGVVRELSEDEWMERRKRVKGHRSKN